MIMNRKLLYFTVVVVIAVATGWNVSRNMNGKAPFSDVSLANVEALADENGGGGNTCYNTITTKDGVQTLYCGTCTYISGAPSWVSGSSTC
jgi:hypothetical protein